jgi:ABC-type lipoprotein export system ATPase subunit
MDILVKINKLSKSYKSHFGVVKLALNEVSIDFNSTGMIFLIGKNGSGKTTFLNMLGALDKPTSGSILINGIDITRQNHRNREKFRRDEVAYVLSNHALLHELTVKENLELPLVIDGSLNKYSRQEKVKEIIVQVDLAEFNDRNINELSSGQLQRVALARALVRDSSILLCDEPTENLDEESTTQILKTLKELSKDKLIIIATHEKKNAYKYGNRIIELNGGAIVNDIVHGDIETPQFLKKNEEIKTRFSIFSILKYFKLFMKKQFVMMLVILGLFSLVLTLFGNFYALSKYSSSDAFASTLQMNDDYVIPVTEYVHTARFLGDQMLWYGAFPTQGEPVSEIRSRLSLVINDRASILESYYFQKNIQDFIDYRVSLTYPYKFTPYHSTSFSDVILVEDFSKLNLKLMHGTMPVEINEVLIYDYMAFNILKTEVLGFSEMENLLDYTLIDKDTQIEMKISGIIQTDYEKYEYTKTGYHSTYPFETLYLARFQSIFAFPEFLDQLETETEYFSFNEIIFRTSNSENIDEVNHFRKFKMVNAINSYTFIGNTLDYDSGMLLSKHQFALIIGVDPIEVDEDMVAANIMDGQFRYLWVDETIDKPLATSFTIPVVGVYESDELDTNIIHCLYGESMNHVKLNGPIRMHYIMLGSNWYENSKLLKELEWPYLPGSFFMENPEYKAHGFAEYTPYTMLINEASGYINSIRNYGLNYAYISLGLLVISLFTYVFSYHKKHTYKIAVISMQGANYRHITFMIAAQLILLTTIAFFISIFPVLRRIELLNRDLTKNLPYDIFFFSMSYIDFLIIYGISIVVVSIGILSMLLYFRSKQPIEMMKDIL